MPTETDSHRLLVENIGGIIVATFSDADLIAEEVIYELDARLGELSAEVGAQKVILSFRGVRSMSSTMLAILLKFGRKVAAAKGRLKLCEITPSILEIFKITRFDRIFEIYAEESTALDSF